MTMRQSISATSLPSHQPQAGTQFLRRVLRTNAIFSALIGVLLAVDSDLVAPLLGLPGRLLTALGVITLLAAVEMAGFATRPQLDLRFVKLIFALDCAWVLMRIALLLTGLLPIPTGGKWSIGVVADIVALFALLEFLGLRQIDKHRRANRKARGGRKGFLWYCLCALGGLKLSFTERC